MEKNNAIYDYLRHIYDTKLRYNDRRKQCSLYANSFDHVIPLGYVAPRSEDIFSPGGDKEWTKQYFGIDAAWLIDNNQ